MASSPPFVQAKQHELADLPSVIVDFFSVFSPLAFELAQWLSLELNCRTTQTHQRSSFLFTKRKFSQNSRFISIFSMWSIHLKLILFLKFEHPTVKKSQFHLFWSKKWVHIIHWRYLTFLVSMNMIQNFYVETYAKLHWVQFCSVFRRRN